MADADDDANDDAEVQAFLATITLRDAAVVIPVRVQPGARREGLVGLHAGRLKVATTVVAERGRATGAVGRLLADVLQVAPSSVSCVSGPARREKVYAASGVTVEVVRARLREALT